MSAKLTFINSEHRAAVEAMVLSPAFQAACDYALLTFVEEQPGSGGDPNAHWDAHGQLTGARRILEILKTLHQPERRAHSMQFDSLKPRKQ